MEKQKRVTNVIYFSVAAPTKIIDVYLALCVINAFSSVNMSNNFVHQLFIPFHGIASPVLTFITETYLKTYIFEC